MKNKLINLATKQALKSEHQFKIGAVLACKNKVISVAFNNALKTHKIAYRNKNRPQDATIHAEIGALINVPKSISSKCDLYIARYRTSNNTLGLAKPCDMCLKVIKSMKIKRVYYTISDNEYGVIDLR